MVPSFFFCSSLSITFAVQFFCCTVTKGQQIRRGVGTNRTHPRTFFRPMHGSMYAGRDLHRRLCARKIYWQGGKAKAIRFVRPLPSIAVFYYKISSHKTGRAAAHNCCRVNRHRGTISTLLLYCCRIYGNNTQVAHQPIDVWGKYLPRTIFDLRWRY